MKSEFSSNIGSEGCVIGRVLNVSNNVATVEVWSGEKVKIQVNDAIPDSSSVEFIGKIVDAETFQQTGPIIPRGVHDPNLALETTTLIKNEKFVALLTSN